MIFFLRNKNNRTIVDLELYENKEGMDLHSGVIINTYSEFLLANLDRKDEIIKDFDDIDQLRGWFWEVYMELEPNPSLKDATDKVSRMLQDVAKKYDLYYVTD